VGCSFPIAAIALSPQIPPQFTVGAPVRIARVASSDQPTREKFVGKTGTVQSIAASVGAVVVALDDGSTRVCLPENLELIERE
jgi:hypothetical protein